MHYAFSIGGQVVFCRESYDNAKAVLAHLANVDALVKEALKISKIIRLEVHGPATELDKLRAPLADFGQVPKTRHASLAQAAGGPGTDGSRRAACRHVAPA